MNIADVEIRDLDVKDDERGDLFEMLRHEQVPEHKFGQIYIITTAPGKIRGRHYHSRKMEWFCVARGKMKLILKDIKTGNSKTLTLSAKKPQTVRIPSGIGHTLENIGKEDSLLIAYCNESHDPSDPDTSPI